MHIDHEELQRRLNSSSNIANSIVEHRVSGARRAPTPTPLEVREKICEVANEPGAPAQVEIAAQFGVSQAVVSTAKNNPPSQAAVNAVNANRNRRREECGRVADFALAKLMKSLDLVTDEMLGGVEDPLKLAKIASQMSGIVNNMERTEEPLLNQNVQVVIYAPGPKTEDRYKSIEV